MKEMCIDTIIRGSDVMSKILVKRNDIRTMEEVADTIPMSFMVFADPDGSKAIYEVVDNVEAVILKEGMWVIKMDFITGLSVKNPLLEEWSMTIGQISQEHIDSAINDNKMTIQVKYEANHERLWTTALPGFLHAVVNNMIHLVSGASVSKWCVLKGADKKEKDDRPIMDVILSYFSPQHNVKFGPDDHVHPLERAVVIEESLIPGDSLSTSFSGSILALHIGNIEDIYDANIVIMPYDKKLLEDLCGSIARLLHYEDDERMRKYFFKKESHRE